MVATAREFGLHRFARYRTRDPKTLLTFHDMLDDSSPCNWATLAFCQARGAYRGGSCDPVDEASGVLSWDELRQVSDGEQAGIGRITRFSGRCNRSRESV